MSKYFLETEKHIQDRIMGEMEEDRIIEVIKEKWDVDVIKTSVDSVLDFKTPDEKLYFEIKSRRNDYKKYPTTMVGYNKIQYIKRHNLECIFIFAFTDGDYYYKYNSDDKFQISDGGRYDRGKAEIQKYYYIPIDKLIKI